MTPPQLYRKLRLIRAVEERLVEVYPSDVIQQPIHLSIGQEAVAVALCSALTSEDRVIGTHRAHALYLANGGSVVSLFRELLGKSDGCSGGMGGSMHLTDVEHGLLGTTSIVGGCLPIACGMAEACRPGQIVACLFGDGACDEGVFYESLNWAALRKLPVLFVCEDNGLAVETPRNDRTAAQLETVATACGIASRIEYVAEMHGNVMTVANRMADAAKRVRERRPRFVRVRVVRAYSHNGIEKQCNLGPSDPMETPRFYMHHCEWQQIDAEVENLVEGAWREAVSS